MIKVVNYKRVSSAKSMKIFLLKSLAIVSSVTMVCESSVLRKPLIETPQLVFLIISSTWQRGAYLTVHENKQKKQNTAFEDFHYSVLW